MPRRLLRDGNVVEDDWLILGDAGVGPDTAAESALIIPFEQWQSDRGRWLERPGRLGVILSPADPVESLVPDLQRFALLGARLSHTPARDAVTRKVACCGSDGASAASCAPEDYVRRDHVFLLARCGFNSFELPENEIDAARSALFTFSAAYQPSNDAGLLAPLAHR